MTGASPGTLWFNGRLYPAAASLPALAADRGLLLGDGLFETVLVRRGIPVLWEAHRERLQRSARALAFPLPDAFAPTLDGAVLELKAALPGLTLGVLRVTLTRGPGPRGLLPPDEAAPTLLLRLDPYDPASAVLRTAVVIDAPRLDPLDPLAGHKTTSALRWIVARQRARRAGADVALLPTIEGDIAEADCANLFAVVDGAVVTPPQSRGVLPGITRAFALAHLALDGRPAVERAIDRRDLARASEVFLTSSLLGVQALAVVDGRSLPEAALTVSVLAAAYAALGSGP